MKRDILCFCASVLGMCAQSASANLLINPSFEQPTVTNPDLFQYYYAGDPSIPGWTIVGGSVDVNTAARWNAHDGTNSIDLTGVTTGGIYQDIQTEIGKTYHLSFWLAGNPEFAGGQGGPVIKMMKLSWGGAAISNLSFDTTSQTDLTLGWTNYAFDLKATTVTTRLEFDSLTGGFAGPMIDDLSLAVLAPPPPLPPAPLPAPLFLGITGAVAAHLARKRWRR